MDRDDDDDDDDAQGRRHFLTNPMAYCIVVYHGLPVHDIHVCGQFNLSTSRVISRNSEKQHHVVICCIMLYEGLQLTHFR